MLNLRWSSGGRIKQNKKVGGQRVGDQKNRGLTGGITGEVNGRSGKFRSPPPPRAPNPREKEVLCYIYEDKSKQVEVIFVLCYLMNIFKSTMQ